MDWVKVLQPGRGETSVRAWIAVALFLVLLVGGCTGSGIDEDGHGGTDPEHDVTVEVATEPETSAENAPG